MLSFFLNFVWYFKCFFLNVINSTEENQRKVLLLFSSTPTRLGHSLNKYLLSARRCPWDGDSHCQSEWTPGESETEEKLLSSVVVVRTSFPYSVSKAPHLHLPKLNSFFKALLKLSSLWGSGRATKVELVPRYTALFCPY